MEMQSYGLVAGSGKVCTNGVCSLVSRLPVGVQSGGLEVWSGKVLTGGVCSLVRRGAVKWYCSLVRYDLYRGRCSLVSRVPVCVQPYNFFAWSGNVCTGDYVV